MLKERAAEKNGALKAIEPRPDTPAIRLGLAGEFQKINASLVAAVAAERMRNFFRCPDIPDDIKSACYLKIFSRVRPKPPGLDAARNVKRSLDDAH